MSVARVDGTAARPLDWNESTTRPATRRRQSTTARKTAQSSVPKAAPAAERAAAPVRRLSAGQVLFTAACWIAIVAGGIAVVAKQAEIAAAGYRITDAQAELAVVQQENERLEANVALLADPERIYRIATEELGMVPRERFEVTVVATAEPVVRPNALQATVASLQSEAAELASAEGFWSGMSRAVVGWLTGQSHQAEAKSPSGR